jgi:hypothetical protein
MFLLPSHWLALPTSIGLGFSMEVFLKIIEKIGYSVFHVEHSSVHCIQKSD